MPIGLIELKFNQGVYILYILYFTNFKKLIKLKNQFNTYSKLMLVTNL